MTRVEPQIVIPMSGLGERFRRAGHRIPKPLIEVEGKPIIQHVVEMFPGARDFVFVCNRDHLADPAFGMGEILRAAVPSARIIPIAPHRLGPVHAVLQAAGPLDPDRPVIVNYCDFTCFWSYADFLDFVAETRCDGAIPAYRDFHPHSLGPNRYAYVKEAGGWVTDIEEKTPFTPEPMREFASSGTYYFASGTLLRRYCEETVRQRLTVGDEFYVSLVYKPMLRDGRRVAVYELQHFMQWGTPEDLAEYVYWSNVFRQLLRADRHRPEARPRDGLLLVPAAGLGRRFAEAGYAAAKPLIPVSGEPMVIQASRDMPAARRQRFVLRRDLPDVGEATRAIGRVFPQGECRLLDGATDGQARTCLLGLDEDDLDEPLTIVSCDNGVLFDHAAFTRVAGEPDADVLVWAARGHPLARRNPEMFSWIDAGAGGRVRAVSVKRPLVDPARDPVVIGAFSFRRAADFVRASERMIARNGTVNGEYYVDGAINDAIALGLECRLFEVDAYVCWGTPDDLRTFAYWQACFDKWHGHPYRLELDSRVRADQATALRRACAWQAPARPWPESRP
jgi:NDP-sugar pyrophosphorylase family protein